MIHKHTKQKQKVNNNMGSLYSMYNKLPISVQNLCLSLYGYNIKNRRFGNEFKKKWMRYR